MTVEKQNTGPVSVSQNQQPKAIQADVRKAALSPELREFMHMLKSLETELAVKPPSAR
jgi:hypothetical protein